MPQYTRNTIPDKPSTLPYKRPENDPGRCNQGSGRVTHQAATKSDPTRKDGGKK